MNSAGAPGNSSGVLGKGLLAAVLALSLGAAGCGAAAREPELGTTPGVTTVVLANRTEAPIEVARVTLLVDEQRLPLVALPPAGGDAAVAARVQLAPGEHTLQVLASASQPSTDGVSTLRTAQVFRVGTAPAMVRVDVGSRDGALDVVFAGRGAELEAPVGQAPRRASWDQLPCGPAGTVSHALCRTQAMLERASGANDVVAVACVRDKLASLRPLADIAADRRGDAEISAMAAERAKEILRRAEGCVGAETVELGPSRAAEQGVHRGAGSAAR